jgi:hypothetical protein
MTGWVRKPVREEDPSSAVLPTPCVEPVSVALIGKPHHSMAQFASRALLGVHAIVATVNGSVLPQCMVLV